MEKPCIEYISACAWCEVFGDLVQVLEKEYEGRVNVKIYRAGKDFDYIKKYGIYVGIIVVVFIAGAILYKKIKDKRGVL